MTDDNIIIELPIKDIGSLDLGLNYMIGNTDISQEGYESISNAISEHYQNRNKYCNEIIVAHNTQFTCKKKKHKDALWHESKTVKVKQKVDMETIQYIMISATWRVERV